MTGFRVRADTSTLATRRTAMVSTGTARRKIRLVAYSVQTKIGKRNQVKPGARKRCVVTMKLRPVKIDEKPWITQDWYEKT